MTNDNKPPMFGPSAAFDPATHEPRSGKSFWMAESDMSSLANKNAEAETLIGNCTTTIPLKLDFHDGEISHSVVIAPSGKGMSVLPELLQDEYQKHGCKPVIFDKGTSLSGLMNQDKEEA